MATHGNVLGMIGNTPIINRLAFTGRNNLVHRNVILTEKRIGRSEEGRDQDSETHESKCQHRREARFSC